MIMDLAEPEIALIRMSLKSDLHIWKRMAELDDDPKNRKSAQEMVEQYTKLVVIFDKAQAGLVQSLP